MLILRHLDVKIPNCHLQNLGNKVYCRVFDPKQFKTHLKVSSLGSRMKSEFIAPLWRCLSRVPAPWQRWLFEQSEALADLGGSVSFPNARFSRRDAPHPQAAARDFWREHIITQTPYQSWNNKRQTRHYVIQVAAEMQQTWIYTRAHAEQFFPSSASKGHVCLHMPVCSLSLRLT
jgi:hypothetical protein